jgi:hypothetical protein
MFLAFKPPLAVPSLLTTSEDCLNSGYAVIGRRMANIIKRFARHHDDVRLANYQLVRGLDARRIQYLHSILKSSAIIGTRKRVSLEHDVL